EEDLVPLDDTDRRALAGVEQLARADRDHPAALGLLLGGVGQHDPPGRLLLGLDLLDHDAVVQRADLGLLGALFGHGSVSFASLVRDGPACRSGAGGFGVGPVGWLIRGSRNGMADGGRLMPDLRPTKDRPHPRSAIHHPSYIMPMPPIPPMPPMPGP